MINEKLSVEMQQQIVDLLDGVPIGEIIKIFDILIERNSNKQ